MKKSIHVSTGEVNAARANTILNSPAIGSCVVIVAYDAKKMVGAMAHVMLPGTSPEKRTSQRTRYAEDAIEEMIGMMTRQGTDRENIEVCLVGGANVLQREDDTICQAIVDSVIEVLHKKNIEIKAKAVGGTERKSVSLNVNKGTINYTEGDGVEMLLWEPRERSASLVTREV
ncbi:MAG: chemotaxis protein CheD [Deltaproteobacteria bacterium]|nr:chemotaxis protein CheD [Candidatus Desulfobacula maris]MBL6964797.1 chemotaxis protein CheD [Bacteroidota bacterium]